MQRTAFKALPNFQFSNDLKRFRDELDARKADLTNSMQRDIRRRVVLDNEALTAKYPDPRERILYRLFRAKEELLMAILLDNRLLEEADENA